LISDGNQLIACEFHKGNFTISTDKNKLQINVIHKFLSKTYWAKNIPVNIVQTSIENSLCYGVYSKEMQIGFARIVTDYSTFAFLADVFILEEFRGKGLSKWLMNCILENIELQKIRGWLLKTADAHDLYKKFGFTAPARPERIMELKIIESYK
jgi:GNAT superfamily N-acetyltransferase